MTDANKYYLDKREAEQEEYDFKDEYEEIAANNVRLEVKLASITSMLSRRIKEHQRLKDMAGSDNSKRREHYRAHALSEALGEVRKIVKGEQDERHLGNF
jgi:uncharacterized protein with von Willebrand factor type A (vWA) domain